MLPSTTGSASRPLLFPIAAWNGKQPRHEIAAIAVQPSEDEEEESSGGTDVNSAGLQAAAAASASAACSNDVAAAASLLPPPSRFAARAVVSGSSTGELVSWESLPPRSSSSGSGSASDRDSVVRLRPRALCFHSGASRVVAAVGARVGGVGVFLSASSEGFVSVWSASGGRCKRSALVLPFAASKLYPLYSFSRPAATGGAATVSILSASPPPSSARATTYVLAVGSSAHAYVLRLPKLGVVGVLAHRAPLVSSCLAPSSSQGPLLATLDSAGHVALWQLNELIGPRAAANNAALSPSPPRPSFSRAMSLGGPRAHQGVHVGPASPPVRTSSSPPIGLVSGAEISSFASPPLASPSPPPTHPLPPPPPTPVQSATQLYVANGAPLHDSPQRLFSLPHATPDNSQDLHSLLHAAALSVPLGRLADDSSHSYRLPHTALSLSPDARHLLVVGGAHVLLLSMSHLHLQLPIQSVAEHIASARAVAVAEGEGEGDKDAIPAWSDDDSLVGCSFLPEPPLAQSAENGNTTTTVARFVLWSAQGGMWMFALEQTPASSTAPTAASVDSVIVHNANSVITPPTPLALRLDACLLLQATPSETLSFASRSHASLSDGLAAPTAVLIDGARVLAGNDSGDLYQYLLPACRPAEEHARNMPAWVRLQPRAQVWLLRPAQVATLASAFDVPPSSLSSSLRDVSNAPSRHSSTSAGVDPVFEPSRSPSPSVERGATVRASTIRGMSRTQSYEHLASRSRRPSITRDESLPELSSLRMSEVAAASSEAESDECSVSCMLVDPVRKQVVLARGMRSGAIQLLLLCGPVRGGIPAAAWLQSSHTPARIDLPAAHSAEVSALRAVERRQGDGVQLLLVSGSVDGSVRSWEVSGSHPGRPLHTWRCGAPVLSIHASLAIPTLPALVAAQKAGMLYPSTSDRVPAAHQLPSSPPPPGSLVLNADQWDASALSESTAMDYDEIYGTPAPELLFVVCADQCVRSIVVLGQSNAARMSQLQSSSLSRTQLECEVSRFVQVYRGHRAPVTSVLFNSGTAARDMLVTQTEEGSVYVFSASSGTMHACIEDVAEAQQFLQSHDLVKAHSQLSLMAYQLRQLSSFAPGLFQLASAPVAPLVTSSPPYALAHSRSASEAPHAEHAHMHAAAAGDELAHLGHPLQAHGSRKVSVRALSLAKLAMKRMSHTLGARRRSSSGSAGVPLPLSVGLGSVRAYSFGEGGTELAAQQHILCTYVLNRFLFHQQNPSFNASVLSSVHQGVGGSADAALNGTAAIVYRPSLIKRSNYGAQSLKSIELHMPPPNLHAAHARFQHLQLSLYALDMQQLNVDLLSRYAALTSSAGVWHHHHPSARDGSVSFDPKREGQAAWHSMLSPLFDWDDGAASVGSLLSHLHFAPPSSHHSYAVFSDRAQALTVLFPSHSRGHRRWALDPEATGLHLLSLSSVLLSLLAAADAAYKSSLDKVLHYYQQHLPRAFADWVEPDLSYLALYALNAAEQVHSAARSLLQGVVERSDATRRAAWWKEWSSMFNAPLYTSVTAADPAYWRRNLFSHALLRRDEATGALASVASVAPHSAREGGKRGLLSSASSHNLFSKRSSGTFSGSSSGGGTSGGSSSKREGLTPSSSLSSLHTVSVLASPSPHPSSPSLPPFVSDKEFMSVLVLVTLYVFEHNSWRARGPQAPPTELLAEMETRVPIIVHTLIRQLAYNSQSYAPIVAPTELVKLALACDLLSRCIFSFRRFIPSDSLPLLVRRLQFLSLNSSLVERSHHGGVGGAMAGGAGGHVEPSPWLALHQSLFHASRRLLLEIGRFHPDLLALVVGKEMLLRDIRALLPAERDTYLSSLLALVRRYPRSVAPLLLDLAHTFLKLIHPSAPDVRAALMHSSLEALRTLSSLFPGVALHEQSGRLAVATGVLYHHSASGTHTTGSGSRAPHVSGDALDEHVAYPPPRNPHPHSVLLFDLRTASKWGMLEGHRADVCAVAFHPSGSQMATYSASEQPPTLRVWKISEGGFVSGLLHTQHHGKQISCFPMPPTDWRAIVASERARLAALAQQRSAHTRHMSGPGGSTGASNPAFVSSVGEEVPARVVPAGAHMSSVPEGATGEESIGTASPHSSLAPFSSPPPAMATAAGIPPSTAPAATPMPFPSPSPPPAGMLNSACSSAPNPATGLNQLPGFSPSPPVASSAAAATPPRISSVQLADRDEPDDALLATRLLSVRLRWQGDSLLLTREDGTTIPFRV